MMARDRPISLLLQDAEAQVARLEVTNAALVVALREEQSHWRAALTAWKGNDTIDIDYSSGLVAEARLTAALSDTAGEGRKACSECGLAVSLCTCVPALRKWPVVESWLPPEVREQAGHLLRLAEGYMADRCYQQALRCIAAARAILDALKVK